LDETLVKASSLKDPQEIQNMDAYDFRVPIGESFLCVSYRPHMVETLKALHKHFELILFTAGHLPYATALALIL
jgi:TFIIF-interacting CTD phosphatase-like protein